MSFLSTKCDYIISVNCWNHYIWLKHSKTVAEMVEFEYVWILFAEKNIFLINKIFLYGEKCK